MKAKVTAFGKCDVCKNRNGCEVRSARAVFCPLVNAGRRSLPSSAFRLDSEAAKRCAEINRREVDALFAKLKHTERSQVRITAEYGIRYEPKPAQVRFRNSRDGAVVEIKRSWGQEFRRWCENCGKSFCTVNEARRLCDTCHDEICETLGVNYHDVANTADAKYRKQSKRAKGAAK